MRTKKQKNDLSKRILSRRSILKMISILGCTSLTLGSYAQNNDPFKEHFIGEIKTNEVLSGILYKENYKKEIIFCYERPANEKTPFDLPKDRSNLSNKSVKTFIQTLEKEGFICTCLNKSILISDPTAFSRKSNPLNKSINGFTFKGSYKELLSAIVKQAQILPPSLGQRNAKLFNIHFDINIKRKITIRDLFLYIFDKYKIKWCVMVDKSPSVFELKRADGSVIKKIKLSPLTLLFF